MPSALTSYRHQSPCPPAAITRGRTGVSEATKTKHFGIGLSQEERRISGIILAIPSCAAFTPGRYLPPPKTYSLLITAFANPRKHDLVAFGQPGRI